MTSRLLAPAGWCLVIATAVWLSSPPGGARISPATWLVLGAACALALGMALPRLLALLYGLAASTTAALVVLTAPGSLSGAPLAPPLGYANANGALCAQGVAAAMVALVLARGPVVRVVSLTVGATLVGLAWATGSTAGFGAAAVSFTVPALVALHRRRSGRAGWLCRAVVALAATGTAAVVLLTILLAALYDPTAARDDGLARTVDSSLSERRVALWSEALQMTVDRPVTGVGAGRFPEASETARRDADARWAHSEFLQLAAETGVVGLLGLVGLLSHLFHALWQSCGRGALATVGACAAAAAAAHAAVDYVLHFWPVPVLALATVGVAVGRASRRHDLLVPGRSCTDGDATTASSGQAVLRTGAT